MYWRWARAPRTPGSGSGDAVWTQGVASADVLWWRAHAHTPRTRRFGPGDTVQAPCTASVDVLWRWASQGKERTDLDVTSARRCAPGSGVHA